MFGSAVHGCGQDGRLSGDGGNVQDDAVILLLTLEAVDGELSGTNGMCDV